MLQLVLYSIALLAALAGFVTEPRQARKIRDGWTPKSVNVPHEQYVAKYRRQLTFRLWIGLVAILILVALSAVTLLVVDETERLEVLGILLFWLLFTLLVTGTPFWCRRILGSPRRSNA